MSTPVRRFRRAIATVAALATVAAGLTFAEVATPLATAPAAEAATPPASAWDPGLIMSDSVMFDSGTMTIAQIQSFLDGKGANCVAHRNADGSVTPCLKDYRESTYDIKAVTDRCERSYDGKANESAATIIYKVGKACDINPKVLIVLLQKEQGLVTASGSGLTPSRYLYATGFACPDTAGCDVHKSGFFRQVYSAAYGFQNYVNNSYYSQYPAFKTSNIQYKPGSNCGTQSVYIQSRATHALYVYTPYVPNAAALANMGGVGDGCSSYGNRNFWVYFSSWFGSPVSGTYRVDTASGAEYLVVQGTRFTISGGRGDALNTLLAPLGSIGRVSSSYISSLPSGGTMSRVVQYQVGDTQYWLLTSKGRVALGDCTQVSSFGANCASLPQFTDDMMAFYPPISAFQNTKGSKYLVDAGKRWAIPAQYASLYQPVGGYKTVDSAVMTLPLAGTLGPVITDGTTGALWLVGGGGRYPISSCARLTALGYDCASASVLSASTRAVIPVYTNIVAANGEMSLIIDGARWIEPSAGIAAAYSPLGAQRSVDTAFASSLPVGGSLSHVACVAGACGSSDAHWLIDSGVKYPVNCPQLHALGYTCISGSGLPTSVLDGFPVGGSLKSDIVVDGSKFHLIPNANTALASTKRQVLDTASAAYAGITFNAAAAIALSADAASPMPYGAPYISPDSIFSANGTTYVSTPTTVYHFLPNLVKDLPVAAWTGAVDGALDPQSVALLPSVTDFAGVYLDPRTGGVYALTSTRPIRMRAGVTGPTIDPALAARFPAPSTANHTGDDVYINITTGKRYFVHAGVRRAIGSAADASAIAKAYKVKGLPALSTDTIGRITEAGATMLTPGRVYRSSKTSKTYYLIDGLGTKRKVSTNTAKEFAGSGIRTTSTLSNYKTGTSTLRIGVICSAQRWIVSGGKLHPVTPTVGSRYPFSFVRVDDSVCSTMPHTAKMGTLFQSHGTIYQLRGKKRYVITRATYSKLVHAHQPPAVVVDSAFLAFIPRGR